MSAWSTSATWRPRSAATIEAGAGPRRLLLGGRFFPWAELGALLDELTGVRAWRMPLPKPVLHSVAAALDGLRRFRPIGYPLTRDAAEMMTTMVATQDQPALDALGLELRPTEESLADTVRWLVEAGHLPAKNAGKLARREPSGLHAEAAEGAHEVDDERRVPRPLVERVAVPAAGVETGLRRGRHRLEGRLGIDRCRARTGAGSGARRRSRSRRA